MSAAPPFRPIAPRRALLLTLGLGVAVTLALAFGCATAPRLTGETLTLQRGQVAPGVYLATLHVLPVLQAHTASGSALVDGRLVRTVSVFVPRWRVSEAITPEARRYYAVVGHELCHAVAQAQALADDPCHREDRGVGE